MNTAGTHTVIVIPGLGDNVVPMRWATMHWRKHGLEPVLYRVGWRERGGDFNTKLGGLTALIDRLAETGNRVSLVGASAGGSMALNAFIQRQKIVYRVINVCGRLRTGPESGFRSFAAKTSSSPVFAQSVKAAEAGERGLSAADRRKFMTVRARFGDELVPEETATLEGAENITVPLLGHGTGIGAALTVFSGPLIGFLNGAENDGGGAEYPSGNGRT